MKKGINLLVTLIFGTFLFGCAGVPKEVIDGLKKDIDGLGTKLTAAEVVLTTIADLEKESIEKLSKKVTLELSEKIDNTKRLIAEIIVLETKVNEIKDSLVVLEGKAKGKIKEDVIALSGETDILKLQVAKFKAADVKLDEIKTILEEKKTTKTTSTPKKSKPLKKKVK